MKTLLSATILTLLSLSPTFALATASPNVQIASVITQEEGAAPNVVAYSYLTFVNDPFPSSGCQLANFYKLGTTPESSKAMAALATSAKLAGRFVSIDFAGCTTAVGGGATRPLVDSINVK